MIKFSKRDLIDIFEEKKYFLFGLFLTSALLWPLANSYFFTHHDDVQVIRLYEMNKCIQDNQIPCRWVPDLGGLYGYPLFNYYAPLPYYYGELFYLLTGSLIFAVKVMFVTAFIGSYIFMYLLARKLWGELGGSLAGIFFSFAPYHAVLLYVRGAMGELWGLMFLPALFWAILRLRENTNVFNSLILALFIALTILSHNLSTMMFLPLCIIFIGILSKAIVGDQFRFIRYVFVAFILGFALSAFYWLPMVSEKQLVHVDTTTSGYFSYTEHFKGLRKLFVERFWGWGASVREVPGGEKDGMSFQIGWIHLVGFIIALYGIRRLDIFKDYKIYVYFFLFVLAISIFLIHPRSQFVWDLIAPMKYLQFPWRLLGLVVFAISVLSGFLMVWIDVNYRVKAWTILTILVVIANYSYFRPEKLLIVQEHELLSGEQWDRQIKRSIFDFLPIYASEPPAELATARYEVIVGSVDVINHQEGTNWFSFNAQVKDHSIIRLSQYYFPNWIVKVNGNVFPIEYENNHLGLMTIILGKGDYVVEGRLYDTPIRIISNWTSIGSSIFLIVITLMQVRWIKGSMRYYGKRIS